MKEDSRTSKFGSRSKLGSENKGQLAKMVKNWRRLGSLSNATKSPKGRTAESMSNSSDNAYLVEWRQRNDILEFKKVLPSDRPRLTAFEIEYQRATERWLKLAAEKIRTSEGKAVSVDDLFSKHYHSLEAEFLKVSTPELSAELKVQIISCGTKGNPVFSQALLLDIDLGLTSICNRYVRHDLDELDEANFIAELKYRGLLLAKHLICAKRTSLDN